MEETVLIEKVHALRSRLRLVESLESAWRWLSPGAWMSVTLAFALKLLGRPGSEVAAALAALPLFALGGGLARYLTPPSLLKAAFRADQQLASQEKLLTATEWVLREKPRTAVAQSLLAEAGQLARKVVPGETFRWVKPPWKSSLLAALTIAILVASPAVSWQTPPPPVPVRVARAADRLEQLAQELPQRAEAQKLRQELEKLARQLRQPGQSEAEAAAKIAAKRRELAQRTAQEGGQDGLAQELRRQAESKKPQASRLEKNLEQAAKRLDKAGDSKSAKAARQALKESQQARQTQAEQTAEALERATAADQELQRQVDQQLASEQSGLTPRQLAQGQPLPLPENAETAEGSEVDFGRGSTNQEESPAEPDEVKLFSERQAERTSDWAEQYEKLYESQRVERQTFDTKVAGQNTEQGGYLKAPGEARGAPARGNPSQREAQQVYLEYRREAEQAVARETIPAEYRDTVRNYFDSIDPRS